MKAFYLFNLILKITIQGGCYYSAHFPAGQRKLRSSYVEGHSVNTKVVELGCDLEQWNTFSCLKSLGGSSGNLSGKICVSYVSQKARTC